MRFVNVPGQYSYDYQECITSVPGMLVVSVELLTPSISDLFITIESVESTAPARRSNADILALEDNLTNLGKATAARIPKIAITITNYIG